MKRNYIGSLILFTLLGSAFLGYYTNAEQGQISLEIKRGFLTIAGSGVANIGSISLNPSPEERNIAIENILQIKDISGLCSGHYTTIQASDLSNGTNYISNQNIFVNFKTVSTIFGKDSLHLSLGPTIANQRGSIKNPTTHIYRSIGTNCGSIGQFSNTGDIKINIPANQTAGTYRGKIYYLLIDNN